MDHSIIANLFPPKGAKSFLVRGNLEVTYRDMASNFQLRLFEFARTNETHLIKRLLSVSNLQTNFSFFSCHRKRFPSTIRTSSKAYIQNENHQDVNLFAFFEDVDGRIFTRFPDLPVEVQLRGLACPSKALQHSKLSCHDHQPRALQASSVPSFAATA